MKLISLDALVAEIERRRDLHYKYYMKNGAGSIAECKYDEDKDILSFLNTLEVKDVDLEAELNKWRHNHFHGRRDKDASGEYLERISQLELAKHFFELGIKAQKGE